MDVYTLERRVAEHINIRKFEEALAKDPSAQYQLSRYHKNGEETDFDRLDRRLDRIRLDPITGLTAPVLRVL